MTPYDLILACLLVAASAHFISISVLFAPRASSRPPSHRPPVTILRPARGIENHIEETLASAFAIDYPAFEIVFCVADENDPILPIVRRLIDTHPNVPARLLLGDDRVSINPKLNNLVKGWRAARHEWIVMADSNVLMPPDYLDRLLAEWSEGVGLVCSPPIGTRPEGAGADFECAVLNTFQGRWQLTADAFGVAFAQGKTMLWRRADLERAGGIVALAAEPAEDIAATALLHRAGLKVRLVPAPFPQPLGRRTFAEVWGRQVRWSQLRRQSLLPLFVWEIFAGGFLPLLLAAVLIALQPAAWPAFALLFIAWYGAEWLLARRMGWPVSPRIAAFFVVRDFALPLLWLAGWRGGAFVWRGNAMNIASPSPAAAFQVSAPAKSYRWAWKPGNKTR